MQRARTNQGLYSCCTCVLGGVVASFVGTLVYNNCTVRFLEGLPRTKVAVCLFFRVLLAPEMG